MTLLTLTGQIYTLVGNFRRGVGTCFKRRAHAAFMLKILELTPFFNGGSDPRNVKVQDKILVGGILLTHTRIPCNAHEIAEIEIPSGSVKDSIQSEIGAASYGTLPFNHSVTPNVVRHLQQSWWSELSGVTKLVMRSWITTVTTMQ